MCLIQIKLTKPHIMICGWYLYSAYVMQLYLKGSVKQEVKKHLPEVNQKDTDYWT